MKKTCFYSYAMCLLSKSNEKESASLVQCVLDEENEEDEVVEIHFWEFVTNNSGQSRPFISLFYNFTIIFRFQWMNGLKIAQNVSSI